MPNKKTNKLGLRDPQKANPKTALGFSLSAAIVGIVVILGASASSKPTTACEKLTKFDQKLMQPIPGIGPACKTGNGLYKLIFPDGHTSYTHGQDQLAHTTGNAIANVPTAPVSPVCANPGEPYNHLIINADADPSVALRAASLANGIINNEGRRFGANVNYRFDCSGSNINITKFALNSSGQNSNQDFYSIRNQLVGAGFTDPKAKYWVWTNRGYLGSGIGEFQPDDSPTINNANNQGPTFALTYGNGSSPSTLAVVMAHENGHNQGAVQYSAPDSDGNIHCTDGAIMCMIYNGSQISYSGFDVNNNGYFNPRPPAGSYLASHWNIGGPYDCFVSNSLYPYPCRDSLPPNAPPNFRLTAKTDTTASLAWDPATDNVGVAGYIIFRNSSQVGVTSGTAFSDSGLTANTSYQYQVKAYDAAGNVSAPANLTVKTCLLSNLVCL